MWLTPAIVKKPSHSPRSIQDRSTSRSLTCKTRPKTTGQRRIVALMLVALVAGVGIGLGAGAREDPPLVFAAKTGVVLTFVLPDKVDEFERFLTEF